MNKKVVEGGFRKEKSSLVNGTNDREAHPKRWVAALVRMNCEKQVGAKLDKLGITTYVPIQREEHQWSDRKKRIGRVVIPMVVFVRISKDEGDSLRRLPYISKFLAYPGVRELATPIPDTQIEQLRFLLERAESPVAFCAQIEMGDIVRVKEGPLKGLEGYYCAQHGSEVAIRLELLGYATTYVSKDHIEKVSVYQRM